MHYYGNAAGSTLRRTLGCLLSYQLGVRVRRVGSGGRYTFMNLGEQRLDDWMKQHAFVSRLETGTPWKLEIKLLSSGLRLPLNVDRNPCLEAVALGRPVRDCSSQVKANIGFVVGVARHDVGRTRRRDEGN
jgi:hypothetical protein